VENWTKIKHVPPSRIVATFDGSWRHLIRWRRAGAPVDESETLLDLSTLRVIPKVVRPLDRQQPHESRKLWDSVTSRLLKKEYNEATKHKLAIEQRQRDEAAERKRKNIE
jgi:oxysterol-binding protein-related protein 9/10/11